MKKLAAVFAASAALFFVNASSAREMEPASPESQGISSRAILRWIDGCEKAYPGWSGTGALHGFVIVRHGKTVAEGSWKPFNTLEETHMLYSHSKSFTSTAVGFLVGEGRLDLDERVTEIFPESLPPVVQDRFREVRVRDLLTMNVGAKKDHVIARADDWARAFFLKKLEMKPGEGFKYDSDATYMLAAIVEKRSGEKLMDYLDGRLFARIGIEKAWSTVSPQGIACGGWGMNMTTREIARFGLWLLQGGRWGGEQVIDPEWIRLATARHTMSGWRNVGVRSLGNGGDWEQGYGFQFWRCRGNGFRADGASGQLTLVYPDADLVVSVNAGLRDMQKEVDLVREFILAEAEDAPLPPDPAAEAALKRRIASLAISPAKGGLEGIGKYLDKEVSARPNRRGIESVCLYMKNGEKFPRLVFRVNGRTNDVPVGSGEWLEGVMRIDGEKHEALGALIGEQKVMTSGGMREDGSFRLKAYLTGTTACIDIVFGIKDGKVVVDGHLDSMRGTRF